MAGKNQFEDPYERLANAIILSAVADYRAALKKVSVMRKVILLWLPSWIISFRIVETRNSSGIGRTGSLYVSIIIM